MAMYQVLKKLRSEHNLKQYEVAAALDISTSSYQKYELESNGVTPSIKILIRIAKFYKVSVDYLLEMPAPESIDYITNNELEKINVLEQVSKLSDDIVKRVIDLPVSQKLSTLEGFKSILDANSADNSEQ